MVPSTRLISTMEERRFTSLGALCIPLMTGKLALTSLVDIFTRGNNGNTFNWSLTPVFLITAPQKRHRISLALLHCSNSTHRRSLVGGPPLRHQEGAGVRLLGFFLGSCTPKRGDSKQTSIDKCLHSRQVQDMARRTILNKSVCA